MGKDTEKVEKVTLRLTEEEQEKVDYFIKTEKAKTQAEAYKMMLTENIRRDELIRSKVEKKGSMTEDEKPESKPESKQKEEPKFDPKSERERIKAELTAEIAEKLREKKLEAERETARATDRNKQRDDDQETSRSQAFKNLDDLSKRVDDEIERREKYAKQETDKNKALLDLIDKKLDKLKPGSDATAAEEKKYAELQKQLTALQDKLEKPPKPEEDEFTKTLKDESMKRQLSIIRGEDKKGIQWDGDTFSAMGNIFRDATNSVVRYMEANAKRNEFKDFALVYNSILSTSKAQGVELTPREILQMFTIAKGSVYGAAPPAEETSFDKLLQATNEEEKKVKEKSKENGKKGR